MTNLPGRGLGALATGLSINLLIIATFLSIGLSGAPPSPSEPEYMRLFFLLCAALAGLLSLGFTWFMSGLLLQGYSREIALRSMFGVRRSSTVSLFWGKHSLSVLLAAAAGLAASLVLNRFFSLLLGFLVRKRGAVEMPVSPAVVGVVLLLVIAHMIVAVPSIALSVGASPPVSLFRPNGTYNHRPRRGTAAIGVLLLAAGYLAASSPDARTALPYLALAPAAVISGTYPFLEGFLYLLLEGLRGPIRSLGAPFFLASSRLSTNLRRTAGTLSAAAIFVAIAVTSGGTLFALASNEKIQLDRTRPNGLELSSRDLSCLQAAVLALRNPFETASFPEIKGSSRPTFRTVQSLRVELTFPVDGTSLRAEALAYSSWRRLLEDTGRSSDLPPPGKDILGTGYYRGIRGAASSPRAVLRSGTGAEFERPFRILREGYALSSRTALGQVVVPDDLWETLWADRGPDDLTFCAVWNPAETMLLRQSAPSFASLPDDVRRPGLEVLLRTELLEEYRRNSGALIFVGSMLLVGFLSLAVSVLCINRRENLDSDRSNRAVLDALGARSRDADGALFIRVALSYLVPVSLGLLHALFALRMLEIVSGFSVGAAFSAAAGVTLLTFSIAIPLVFSHYRREIVDPA